MSRCRQCGDLSPEGWRYCRRCHAWDDLAVALQHAGTSGIDEFRLRRALSYISPRRRAHPLAKIVGKLMRRVEQLEAQVEALL